MEQGESWEQRFTRMGPAAGPPHCPACGALASYMVGSGAWCRECPWTGALADLRVEIVIDIGGSPNTCAAENWDALQEHCAVCPVCIKATTRTPSGDLSIHVGQSLPPLCEDGHRLFVLCAALRFPAPSGAVSTPQGERE